MNPVTVLVLAGLLFLVQGLVALVRPAAMLAIQDWIASRLWKRPPLSQRVGHVRAMGAVETLIGGLILAITLS